MTPTIATNTERASARSRRILLGAGATTLIAVAAGIALLAVDPAAGSNTEASLGFTAAVSGLATGALVAAAAIHASVTGLWERLSIPVRYVLWAALAVVIVHNLWTQLQHLD